MTSPLSTESRRNASLTLRGTDLSVPLCIWAEDFEVEKDKALHYALLGGFPSSSKTFLHLICNLTQPKEL